MLGIQVVIKIPARDNGRVRHGLHQGNIVCASLARENLPYRGSIPANQDVLIRTEAVFAGGSNISYVFIALKVTYLKKTHVALAWLIDEL
jgi:hypothetical protein